MNFGDRFSEKPSISNCAEIRPIGTAPIHTGTDGRTDMRKLIGAFRDYANEPK